MKDKKLTAKEAADIIGVRYGTLLNWHSAQTYAKDLKFHKTIGGRLYLMEKNVRRFAGKYSL